jgi:hypothetical protein
VANGSYLKVEALFAYCQLPFTSSTFGFDAEVFYQNSLVGQGPFSILCLADAIERKSCLPNVR